jgi:hypothetical protein
MTTMVTENELLGFAHNGTRLHARLEIQWVPDG